MALKLPGNVGRRTLDPTKHPPDGAATHSMTNPCKFRFGLIFCIPGRSKDLRVLVGVTENGGGTHTSDNAWKRQET